MTSEAVDNLAVLLETLGQLRIRIWAEGDRLHYAAPPGVLTPELKAGLAQNKIDLLKWLKKAENQRITHLEGEGANGPRALSFAQERIWFLEQLNPGTSIYNLPIGLHLAGELNLLTLGLSIREIISRHTVLRTHFIEIDGRPFQKVIPIDARLDTYLHQVDLRHLPAENRMTAALELIKAEAVSPFDLSARHSLMRSNLFQLDNQEYILLLIVHHIAADMWSLGIMLHELVGFYNSFSSGAPGPFEKPSIQYADFAEWQRNYLQGETLQKQVSFWQTHLAACQEVAPVLSLPTDRPYPPIRTFKGGSIPLIFLAERMEKLVSLCRAEKCTLFMALLAAFQTLLYRYSGQSNIIVGVPIANRLRAESEGLIGFFVNTLAIRSELNGQLTFLDLLHQVRDNFSLAIQSQDLPFERLVQILNLERKLSQTTLFQVMFVYQNTPISQLELPNLKVSPLDVSTDTTKYDLTLFLTESHTGLTGALTYNSDIFEPSTVARLAESFFALLESIGDHSDLSLNNLTILSTEQQNLFLTNLSVRAKEKIQIEPSFSRRFEAQVMRNPDMLALAAAGQSLSYDQLNRKANRLARHLQSLGVGPNVAVAIYLPRCVDLLVAVLAIFKAGGAYLPIDPAIPAERLAFLISDSASQAVITHRSLARHLPVESRSVVLDEFNFLEQATSDINLAVEPLPDHLAYIIYTSGTTGQPKGVLIEHGALMHLDFGLRQAIFDHHPGGSPWRVSLNAPLTFDSSVKQLTLLLSGHCVVIVPEEVRRDPPAFLAFLESEHIDVLDCTPSQLQLLVESGLLARGAYCPALVLVGGEAIPVELWQRLMESQSTAFYNVYGPTECTVDATAVRISPATPAPCLGWPIGNTEVLVLDRRLQPVPLGFPGELCLGGPGLARGYLNRPELTAERFVQHPFRSGERLYRTGDRARYLPDGAIEFLGRSDTQVKLRGYRVELGEIEACLRNQASVREAAVLLVETHLVAYVVMQEGLVCEPPLLRAALLAHLPDYMVPAFFIPLSELPLSPNGKLDRRSLLGLPLPAPTAVATASLIDDPLLELITSQCEGLLGVRPVRGSDNFFELGGHSLLAARLMARIRQATGVNLPLRLLFDTPSLAALAEQVRCALGRSVEAQVPIVPVDATLPLPLSFSQQRLWFLDQLEPGRSFYSIPAALRLSGTLDPQALETALSALIVRHASLRTTFEAHNGMPFQVIHPVQPFQLQITDLSTRADPQDEARQIAIQAAERPFDLARGPLFRALLLRIAPQEHLLVLVFHHIISDAWSLAVFTRELSVLYSAAKERRVPDLPSPSIQYHDFSTWQQAALQGSALQDLLDFWLAQLPVASDGAQPVLALPGDHARLPVQSYRGGSCPIVLPTELTRRLRLFSQQQGCTLFMTLLGAFSTLLFRYTGQNDIRIGVPYAGRSRPELEGLIGFFVNTLVIRSQIDPHQSFSHLVHSIRETTLAAYAHAEMPFERLVEALQPDRSLSINPLIQVMFAFENTPAPHLDLPGLTVQAQPLPTRTAKFDLTLALADNDLELQGEIEYNADLFNRDTIERMVSHLITLLECALDNSGGPLAHLNLLPPAERSLLLERFQPSPTPLPETTLAELFEAQVARSPQAVAIVDGLHSLSYADLNARANRLARYLRSMGVGPEVIVAICLERSSDLLVALLAVLKAGGAYLPIDPAYPVERRSYLLQDSQAAILLSHSVFLEGVSSRAVVICLDQQPCPWENLEAHNLPALARPQHLAYVIYTSGSTGKPKGVLIEQRSIVNHCLAMADIFNLTSDDRVLQFAAPGFDVALEEIFPTWYAGATLILRPLHLIAPDAEFQHFISQKAITVLNLPSPFWHAWSPAEISTLPVSLRLLILGSDRTDPAHFAAWRASLPGRVQLANAYGLTEMTVTSLIHFAIPQDSPRLTSVPIGRPISNTRAYIVDSQTELLPLGFPGELCLSGVGLARGYLNRPDETAEVFIPDPFSPGQHLYRTGDRARCLPDGLIEFVGRKDAQLKIRGFRIEPAEIVAVLRNHPTVADAIVLPRRGPGGELSLAAFVVPAIGMKTPDLRPFLSEYLPAYMIPASFSWLDALPLTPHGKVDTLSLIKLLDNQPDFRISFTPARDRIELELQQIWEETLQIFPISVKDDFFSLGGHSLLALSLIAKIRKRWGNMLPIATLFQNGTIEKLANLLRMDTPPDLFEPLVSLNATGSSVPFFCVHPAGGNILSYVDLARELGKDHPFYALQARGLDGNTIAQTTINEMATDYIHAVRHVQPEGPYCLGGWSLGGLIAFEMAHQLQLANEKVALLALFDSDIQTYHERPIDEMDDIEILIGLLANEFTVLNNEIHQLSKADQRKWFFKKMKDVNLLPEEIEMSQAETLLRVYKTSTKAMQTYHPPFFAGRVHLFISSEKQKSVKNNLIQGWSAYTDDVITIPVTGDHQSIIHQPNVQIIAKKLTALLKEIVP